jgi:hypothetical protein
MTIAAQANSLVTALNGWVRQHKGFVKLAGDEADLFTVLGAQPGAVRVGVMFDEETPTGENLLGYVDRKFVVAVSRGKGFFVDEAHALAGAAVNETPLFLLVEEVREVLRSLRFDLVDSGVSDCAPDYLGTKRVQYEGHVVGAYAVEISLTSHIPQQTDSPDE